MTGDSGQSSRSTPAYAGSMAHRSLRSISGSSTWISFRAFFRWAAGGGEQSDGISDRPDVSGFAATTRQARNRTEDRNFMASDTGVFGGGSHWIWSLRRHLG